MTSIHKGWGVGECIRMLPDKLSGLFRDHVAAGIDLSICDIKKSMCIILETRSWGVRAG